jgi:hypothetical protein
MQETKMTGPTRTTRVDLNSGHSEVVRLEADHATIAIQPGLAGSVTVAFTGSNGGDIDAGDALWVPAAGLGAGGMVTELTMDVIPSALTAIRITATGAAARVEVTQ